MLNTLRREPSGQPAAAIAAKDRATVEKVLQKVLLSPFATLMGMQCQGPPYGIAGWLSRMCCMQTICGLQGVRQQLAHVTDTATAAKVLKNIESQLKVQARVSS